ncbi:MAG: transglycosylase SLT domain-containing protein [Gemmatimonadales bacterium]
MKHSFNEPSDFYLRILAIQDEIDQLHGTEPRSKWSSTMLELRGGMQRWLRGLRSRITHRLVVPLAFAAFFAGGSIRPMPFASPIVVTDTLSSDAQRDTAVRQAAIRWGINVDTALAISHTENWRGIPGAWSRTGCCVGIMQVNVRHWYGRFHEECGNSDLFDIRTNACYGVLIWQHHLRECGGDGDCALRAYVGQRNNLTVGDFYLQEIQRYLVAP